MLHDKTEARIASTAIGAAPLNKTVTDTSADRYVRRPIGGHTYESNDPFADRRQTTYRQTDTSDDP